MKTTLNRRQHPRFAVEMECKLRRPSGLSYTPARTGDISAGGALLEIRTARPVRVGETLDVAMNWANRPVLASGDLVRARVVRVGPVHDETQRVAVRFDVPQAQADRLGTAEAA